MQLLHRAAFVLASALAVAACTTGADDAAVPDELGAAPDSSSDDAVATDVDVDIASPTDAIREPRPRFRYPPAPPAPAEDVANVDADAAIDRLLDAIGRGFFDAGGATLLAESGDIRHAWFVSDVLRFVGASDAVQLLDVFEDLTGVDASRDPVTIDSPWLAVTNHLMAWDTPAYDGYVGHKGELFTLIDDRWAPFFADDDAGIDWRLISWGGVLMDDRPLGTPEGCPGGCIPALDDFRTTDAAGGDWYPDERIVFGLEVNGESLAVPLHIAEIHEMFNFTLGDRRIAMPYCTLCGSAQAYFTDTADGSPVAGADEIPVLRTSGLLSQSNKVMFDLTTFSVFDTFTGAAVSGPLQDAGVELEELTVVRSTWNEWKRSHPDTRIVAEDGGIGRRYDLDPLGDRDADGPIFPIGDADDRLDVQELVVGVLPTDGVAVAFPSEAASVAIESGQTVEASGVRLEPSGDGLVAVDADTGEPLAAHESFWFAWSQFHPETELWLPE